MTNNLYDFQKFAKAQLGVAGISAPPFVKSLQTIAAEATDYSKKSFENGAAFLEKLRGANSFENAIQIQSDYAKASCEAFIAQATKIGELYSDFSKEAFKPIESAIAKVQASKE